MWLREKYTSGEKALTEEEEKKLLAQILNPEHKLMIILAIETGLRREDLVNVKISNILFDEKQLLYYEMKKRRTYSVYLSDGLVEYIKLYLNTLPKPRLKEDKLFHFKGRRAYDIFNGYCDKAGIARRGMHALRATCIKRLQKLGWTPLQTAKQIGDSVRTVELHYATPSQSEMKELVKKRDKVD